MGGLLHLLINTNINYMVLITHITSVSGEKFKKLEYVNCETPASAYRMKTVHVFTHIVTS